MWVRHSSLKESYKHYYVSGDRVNGVTSSATDYLTFLLHYLDTDSGVVGDFDESSPV